MLFGFEAFCAGGVRFIAGIVKYGSELTESSMIRNLHPADFVAVFFINGLIYCVLITLFKKIGVNKMLDKDGTDFDKLLLSCREKQKKPLKVPYKQMTGFDIETKSIDGTTSVPEPMER